MLFKNFSQQSGRTAFMVLIVGALMGVIIGSVLIQRENTEKWSPADERNQLPLSMNAGEYNRPAYTGIMASIRNSLDESKLSKKAKSVYITMVDGAIVISGDVVSKVERLEVIKLSRDEAGLVPVKNQLNVVPVK